VAIKRTLARQSFISVKLFNEFAGKIKHIFGVKFAKNEKFLCSVIESCVNGVSLACDAFLSSEHVVTLQGCRNRGVSRQLTPLE